jgi:Sec-independent protein translocase protein TatA
MPRAPAVNAFVNNLSVGELLLIAVAGLLLFGRRLPEIAVQAAAKLDHLKRSMGDLRREIGIDQEIQSARRAMYDLKREASIPPLASITSEIAPRACQKNPAPRGAGETSASPAEPPPVPAAGGGSRTPAEAAATETPPA